MTTSNPPVIALQTPGTRSSADWPKVVTWTRACVVGAMVGVTAAASTGEVTSRLGHSFRDQVVGLAVVLTAGLIAGLVFGWLQAQAFVNVLARRRHRWVLVTVAVAGVGWAAASAPNGFADQGSSSSSLPLWMVVGGAAVLGAGLGAFLGVAQAMVLRPLVSHPWRWVGISALAWSPAVAVVALGATAAPESWPVLAVVLLAAPILGAAAGFLLGRISGSLLPALSGADPHDLAVLALLGSPAHVFLGRALVGLSFSGAVTGRTVRLPVRYARLGDQIVVLPRRPDSKHWWHNLDGPLTDVLVLLRGRWRSGVAEIVRPGPAMYDTVRTAYLDRWPSADLAAGQPVVLVSGLLPTTGGKPR